MKLPRNARILAGQLDSTALIGVFFVLLMFLMLQSSLVFTPGVRVQLPAAEALAGVGGPAVAVAVDYTGQFFFENQAVKEDELRERLRAAARESRRPLTLLIQADEAVNYKVIVRLSLLARESGIAEALLATRPKPFAPGPLAP
jgi:biopolymer transport protein ExbD